MRLAEDVGSTNIFLNPDVVETMHIDANSLLEEVAIYTTMLKEFHDACAWLTLLGIDPYIIEHGIRTYLDSKLVRRRWKKYYA